MEIRVVRSRKRRKTVSATLDRGTLVVRIPAWFSKREEQEWVEKMRERLSRRQVAADLATDQDLVSRAERLNRRFFQGQLDFAIRWVTNQQSRWGSCTPLDGTIRISHVLAGLPEFVLDYVIVHELAHLLVADHSPAFWELVHRYPHTQKAIGFLEGYEFARNTPTI